MENPWPPKPGRYLRNKPWGAAIKPGAPNIKIRAPDAFRALV